MLLGRAEKCRRLDPDRCPRWAGLHAGLVVVARAQVALDCQFLAHLTKGIYWLMDIQRPGRGSALQHWERFAPALLARAFLVKVAELVPGIARLDLIFQCHNRNAIVGPAYGADPTPSATFAY